MLNLSYTNFSCLHLGYVALRIYSKSIITSPFSNTHFLTLHTTDTDSGFNKALVSEVPIYAGPIIHPTVHVWLRLPCTDKVQLYIRSIYDGYLVYILLSFPTVSSFLFLYSTLYSCPMYAKLMHDLFISDSCLYFLLLCI